MNICMNEAVGKTVARVVEHPHYSEWLITFTDGAYALIEAEEGYGYGDVRLVNGSSIREGWKDSTLIELGLLTQAEVYAEAAEAAEAAERAERAEYERLRAKFGGGR